MIKKFLSLFFPTRGKTYAKVILKSKHPVTGKEITTFELCYPLIVHAHLLTHRVFSRNTESARAIKTNKLLSYAWNYFYEPSVWRKASKGMSPQIMTNIFQIFLARTNRYIRFYLVYLSVLIDYLFIGSAKEIVNRALHEFMYVKVVLTTTDLQNFYELRNHPDAQQEIKELAEKMIEAEWECKNVYELNIGEWHLPYCTIDERYLANRYRSHKNYLQRALYACVSRCGRVSYSLQGGEREEREEKKFHDRELNAEPMHGSVFEHAAKIVAEEDYIPSNLCVGFNQYRKYLEKDRSYTGKAT